MEELDTKGAHQPHKGRAACIMACVSIPKEATMWIILNILIFHFNQFVASIHIISSLFKPFHANEGYDNIYYRVRKIL